MAIEIAFWDIGGVLLTNGWDRKERASVVSSFGLDPEDFEERHGLAVATFESGRMTLEGYLHQTVFCHPRNFSEAAFKERMFAQSKELPGVLEVARALSGRLRMATLNNESRELNDFRIATFGLGAIFSDFFSSCYLGRLKPDPQIYQTALAISGKSAEQSLFIDDRPLNLETAESLGFRVLQFQGADRLRADLGALGLLG
jgi:putative hydrolase of the HAD superfamily